jgi:HK97 family phage major capsid protein
MTRNIPPRGTVSSAPPKADLGAYLYYTMQADNPAEALRIAEAKGANARVIDLLQKTSSPAFDTSNLTSPYSLALSRMIASNTPKGAFESMKGDMVEVPLRSRFVISTAALTGSEVGEGSPKPVRRLSVTNLDTEVSKHTSMVAVTIETLQESPELVQRVLATALPEAVNRSVDTYFLSKLQGEEIGESSGEQNPTWQQVTADLHELLNLVQVGEASKLFYVMQARSAKYLSKLAFENGISTVTYRGGSIFGVPIVTTQSITSGRITLADASGIAFGDDGLELRQSDQCSVELTDTPTNASATSVTQTQLVSAFQTGMRVLLAEKSIAVRVLDTNAIASLSGVQWGVGSDSPAGV